MALRPGENEIAGLELNYMFFDSLNIRFGIAAEIGFSYPAIRKTLRTLC